MKALLIPCLLLSNLTTSLADGPTDNSIDGVRPVPPLGIPIPEDTRASLQTQLGQLGSAISQLAAIPAHAALLPDVEIYHKAVHDALAYGEFYKPEEFEAAKSLLEQGQLRASELAAGIPSWPSATGLIARGYRSKIDGSIQPYGLVVPRSYQPHSAQKHRLDAWFHGRSETLTELDFIQQRQSSAGQFTPKDTLVLHLYGRYCNANKLAGEIDLFEALAKVKEQYRIDDDRIVIRGFSMGGAACWQFAVHHAGLWAAAAPGAGFSETPDFLKVFQNETLNPTWFEKKLWHQYDCTDWAVNLTQCPTVAYSGEIDKQKQAADIMAVAMAKEGIDLVHLIGPGMGHKYHPDSIKEIDRRIDALAKAGRDPLPLRLRFTTWTLRYPTMNWLTVNGLHEHWERAKVDAEIHPKAGEIHVSTTNISALTIDLPPGQRHFDVGTTVKISINGSVLESRVPSDSSFTRHLVHDKQWKTVSAPPTGLVKRPGLQGPIDDAFMDSFMMVKPSGQAWHTTTQSWVDTECTHASEHWRKQFRGVARVKQDTQITDEDIASHNLILWGDPSSNAIIARVVKALPVAWTRDSITVGDKSYAATDHIPTLIYPNPLNPDRYIVFNSGFTFREYDYLNNARQVPKLPDWAIIDITKPVTSRWPGGIADAGFYGEAWELKPHP